MKITKDFELSGIVKVVIDKKYVWHLCTTSDPSGREDFIWILNAEDAIVDDSAGDLPDTHFKSTGQMGAYIRDLVHGGMHRGWVHWDTLNFESIVVKCNCDCECERAIVRSPLLKVILNMREERNHNESMKLNTKLRGNDKENDKTNETFKKFGDYFLVGPAIPVDGEYAEAHGESGAFKLKRHVKDHKIDWIK